MVTCRRMSRCSTRCVCDVMVKCRRMSWCSTRCVCICSAMVACSRVSRCSTRYVCSVMVTCSRMSRCSTFVCVCSVMVTYRRMSRCSTRCVCVCSVMVNDGTCNGLVFLEGEQVRRVLDLSQRQWSKLEEDVGHSGEINLNMVTTFLFCTG